MRVWPREFGAPTELHVEDTPEPAATGPLRPVIGQRFPPASADAAHAAIEARQTVGKTLLVTGGAGG